MEFELEVFGNSEYFLFGTCVWGGGGGVNQSSSLLQTIIVNEPFHWTTIMLYPHSLKIVVVGATTDVF